MIKLIKQNDKHYSLCKIVIIPSTEKSNLILFGDRLFFSENFILISEADICYMNSNDIGKVTYKHNIKFIEDLFYNTNKSIFCLRENGEIYSFDWDNYGDDGYYQYKLGEQCFYQHIYIFSDEEIKRNDYFLDIKSGIINHWFKFFNAQEKINDSEFKKIIATTNTSLRFNWDGTNNCVSKSFPKPPIDFIIEHINNNNINNVITKVLVEYEYYDASTSYYDNGCGDELLKPRVKINFIDNTIAVKEQKANFSREEVIEFAKLAIQINSSKSLSTGFKWIEENL